jgi:hypothetical protein
MVTVRDFGAVGVTAGECEGMDSMEMVAMFVARFYYYSD